MTDRPAIAAVAFDLMDTLVHDPWKAGLRAAFGDRFEAAMADRDPSSWPRFETGAMTEAEFWATYVRHQPDPDACREVRITQTAWLPGMQALVDDVRDLGVPVALASNYPSWFEDIEHDYAPRFDAIVVSYRVGVRKPDPGFYDRVAKALDAPHSAICFVDDRASNVDAAAATGMTGITFSGANAARQALRDLGLPI